MDVYTTSMVPSTSNEPPSLDSQSFGRVCSQRYCETLLWPGSKSDICDRCLARMEGCSASIKPRDTTRAYAKTASLVKGAFYDPKDLEAATSVAPVVSGSAACSAPSSVNYTIFRSGNLSDHTYIFPKYPLPPPSLLPNSQLESNHSLEAEIRSKPSGHDSLSMSYQGRRFVYPSNSAIGVPLYSYHSLRRKPEVYTEDQNRMQPQLCGVCRAIIYSETGCPHCHFDVAPFKEKTRFEQRDYLSESKDIAAKSDLEDDLSTAVMSIFSEPDENLDDTDDVDMEGIELSYPEVMDSEPIEGSQLQPSQECSGHLKGSLSPEKNPQHSNQVVLEFAQNFPNWKGTPRNTFRSLKLCSTVECTGTILSESLATRCLGCVRRDWKSRGRAGHRADDERLNSENIKQTISTKQKTKKAVTWADEVFHTPASQQQLQHDTLCMDSSSKHDIYPVVFDDDPLVSSDVQVGRLPSPSTETRVPIKCLESNDPSTKSKGLSVFTRVQEDLSATPVDPVSNDGLRLDTQVKSVVPIDSGASLDSAEVSIIGGSSDLSDLSDSRGNNESDDISSLASQGVVPQLPKLEAYPPLASTGLKIHIPPRPGLYVQKCRSIRCEQRLPATYRWKSCVMCRARSRGSQRKRQNQGSLLDEESFGTTLSRDILVVAGARLCSDRNCTHIIPPSIEYLWKRCALCRLRARSSRKFDDTSLSQEVDSRVQIAELPKRDKHLPGRCRSLDCGMLLSGKEAVLDCNQCLARSSCLINDGTSKQTMAERKAKSIPAHPSLAPSPYPRYKAFPNLLADLKARFNDFLRAQSVLFLYNAADGRLNLAKAMFIFDAEYSIVALDFDIVGRKDAVDINVLKLKGEIERMGRIQFSPKRYISFLEGGGIAERFICLKQAPVLQTVSDGQNVSTVSYIKDMQGELEIAIVPDHSHPFLPGRRTIVRFRLLG